MNKTVFTVTEDGILTSIKSESRVLRLPEYIKNISEDCSTDDETKNRIKKVYVPQSLCKKSDENLFKFIRNFEELIIQGNLKSDDFAYFKDFPCLKKITFTDGVTRLPKRLFWGCINLSEVNLPESLTKLPDEVFFDCTFLKSLTLPASLEVLDPAAFSGTNNIYVSVNPANKYFKSSDGSLYSYDGTVLYYYHCCGPKIVIPDSVKLIKSYAFECKGLEWVKVASDTVIEENSDVAVPFVRY